MGSGNLWVEKFCFRMERCKLKTYMKETGNLLSNHTKQKKEEILANSTVGQILAIGRFQTFFKRYE